MAKYVGILIFCAAILLIFIALDIGMLISIVRSGDERRQIIVWKASAFTLTGNGTGDDYESFRSSDSYGHGLFRGAVIF